VSLDHVRVWSNVHVPRISRLNKKTKERAVALFNKVGKTGVKSIYERIGSCDEIQRSVDELALEMLGLDAWKGRLNEVYDAVAKELLAMQKILGTSQKKPMKSRAKRKRAEKDTKSLKDWLKSEE
jgi:hypothetical protein